MAIEQPTAAEWREIAHRLEVPWHPVYLDCDGYRVRLCLDQVGKMELGITVFVDGVMRMQWLGMVNSEPSEEGRRFFPEKSRYLWDARARRRAQRALGNREAAKLGAFERQVYRWPWWRSVNSLRRHLVQHNDRIRLLSDDEARERMDAIRREKADEKAQS